MCVQAKLLGQSGEIISSTWYPVTKLKSPGTLITTDLDLTESFEETKPEKKTAHHHEGMAEGCGDCLLSHKICMAHHIDWMAAW